ncbi:MAG TPA: hypothetical protein PLN69_04460 [bacterium]|nr:hypothetical protein [bacterium]
MKKALILFTIFLSLCSACLAAEQNTPGEPAEPEKRTILTVDQLISEPGKYVRQKVVVVGMFMGWDGKCRKPMPKSGDWMIQSETGACVWARGFFPDKCDARTKIGEGTTVSVEGYFYIQSRRKVLLSTRKQKIMQKQQEEREKQNKEKIDKAKKKLEQIEIKQQQLIFTPGEIAGNPNLFKKLQFFVKGRYYPTNESCLNRPAGSESLWALQGTDKICVFLEAGKPVMNGEELKPGSIKGLNVIMKQKKIGESDFFYLVPAQIPIPESNAE